MNLSIGTAFGCPMEGPVAFDDVLDIGDEFVAAGVTGISLCDTTGMANPAQVRSACAGLAAGVVRFDASLGGLGGCPFAPGASGNVCTEDLVHMLEAMGCATGIDLGALVDCAARLPGLVHHDIRGQVWRAGPATIRHPRPADFDEIAARAHARQRL